MRDRLGLITGGEPDPYPTADEFEHDLQVMKTRAGACARHGITFIHNMDGNLYTLELLEELRQARRFDGAREGAVPLQEFHGSAGAGKSQHDGERYHLRHAVARASSSYSSMASLTAARR